MRNFGYDVHTRTLKRVLATLVLAATLLNSPPAFAGLRVFYTFEGTTADVSGHGLDAVPGSGAASPSFTTNGYEGQAMSFDGGDFLTVPLDVNPSSLPTMTWGAWVWVRDRTPNQQVLSHDDGGFDRSVGIDSRGGIWGQFSAFTGSGVLGNGPAVTLSNWVFLAVVYNNTNKSMTLWVDDNKTTATSNFGSGWNTFRIGSNPSYGEYFKGCIDNVFVFDTALTESEIAHIRTGGAAAILSAPRLNITNSTDGIIVYWLHSTNIFLQQNPDLSPANWTASTFPVTVTNSNATVNLSPITLTNLFFRLEVR